MRSTAAVLDRWQDQERTVWGFSSLSLPYCLWELAELCSKEVAGANVPHPLGGGVTSSFGVFLRCLLLSSCCVYHVSGIPLSPPCLL